MHSNLWIFLLFAISLNFPSIIKIGFSAAPFGFLFCSLLVFPYLLDVVFGRKKIEIKSLSIILVFLLTILWGIYSLNVDPREYFIRFFQVLSALVVYIYSKEKFFLNLKDVFLLKILLICQLPSILFGLLEVVNIFFENTNISSILYNIRSITAAGREDVVFLNTIVLHFLEHSMSSFYFISMLIIIFIFLFDKDTYKNEIRTDKLLKTIIFLFLIISIFHRSTSYLLIIGITLILLTIYLRRLIILLIIAPIFAIIILSSPQLFIKFSIMLEGGVITSDMFRATTLISSFATFIDTYLFGSGSGTFSKTYYSGVLNFINLFDLSYYWENLILSNNYVDSYKYGNRPPLNSAYGVLISEYGLFFILFIFFFHKNCLKFKSIYDIFEIIIFVCLFLSYPIALPYLWLALGYIHRKRDINQTF